MVAPFLKLGFIYMFFLISRISDSLSLAKLYFLKEETVLKLSKLFYLAESSLQQINDNQSTLSKFQIITITN